MQTENARDWELLRRYVRHNSEAAFGEIVSRYINLVYAASRREVGDAALAEDVTQVVFLTLARRAPLLLPETVLPRWLFAAARFTARDVLKQERRRKAREMKAGLDGEAAPMAGLDGQAERETGARPLELAVNAALATLSSSDWEAVHLRFYEERSLAEIGRAFGVSEDAAQKRVTRALQRLRRSLTAGGFGLGAVAVEELMRAESARAASEACVQAVLGGFPASGGAGLLAGSSHIHHLARGVLKTMFLKNAVITGAVVLTGVTGFGVAPLIGGALRGAHANAAQQSAHAAHASSAKADYAAHVAQFNRRLAEIQHNLDLIHEPNAALSGVKISKTGLVIRAYVLFNRDIETLRNLLERDPDIKSVAMGPTPNYPDTIVNEYYLGGKLVGAWTKDGTPITPPRMLLPHSAPTARDSRPTTLLPEQHVYPVPANLQARLAAAHSKEERVSILSKSGRPLLVMETTQGSWLTITAELKEPVVTPAQE